MMKRVLITGGRGMLGRALARAWASYHPNDEVVTLTRADADLRDPGEARRAIVDARPDLVLHTAARVGGIAANLSAPTEFLVDNLRIDDSVIGSAHATGIKDLVYFGSSCMYPKDYRQPLVESDILAAPLEPSNEGYALAKITAAKRCEYITREFGLNYRVVIPSNLYGPNDHFGSVGSHLVAAALHKAYEAKKQERHSIDVWGSGRARREFTYVDDLAGWVAVQHESIAAWPVMMNVGAGVDYSVLEYYQFALNAVEYECELVVDPSKPEGMLQKLMDSSVASEYGWSPSTGIVLGMANAYQAMLRDAPASVGSS